ncbi:MAG: M23 family metallopeptidase [Candidatus Adiutrix sp.]|nr:M23 family metallopeptidase [Candidatus Adiutrix sp.]
MAAEPVGAEPEIKILPMPVDRGTAARVLVEGLDENSGLTGMFDGRPVFFFPAGNRLIGLLAADVMLSPGHYPLTLKWNNGAREVDVTVRDRAYGVRSIKVPDRQVNLSKSDQDRAVREQKLVIAALETKSPRRLWREPWVDPVGGQVNSSFGRQTKMNGVLNPRPHAGADYSVPTGTEVRAPADGVVLLADEHFFAGNSVYVDHGQGLISMYFHLSAFKVKAGDPVKRGDALALSGATGRVTGAHLHYGVYLSRARIDPVAFHRLTSLLPSGEDLRPRRSQAEGQAAQPGS